ncbi:unnamed protein product [Toxocara canis]|uniref:E3 ubiquitin-protein ligase n=1 Tax=Toxocara canis TaxID=6265 RepID=A0A183VCR1_TOXCA|nr:unnamed protein product [Toxocara canis]
MWARNGNAARNQSFYYAQTNYNTAFLDCDIALLRLLLELVVVAWNTVGNELREVEREVVAALAIGDLTHSKLKSAIPEKGSRSSMSDEAFDSLLTALATYSEPDQGSHIQQGVFRLSDDSWRDRFEPVFCRMRATTAREFSDALLRAENIERSRLNRSPGGRSSGHLWTPYRLIDFNCEQDELRLNDIGKLLISPTFFEILYEVLTMHVDEGQVSDSIVQQVIYLLTLSVSIIRSERFTSISNGDLWKRGESAARTALVHSAFHRRRKPDEMDERAFALSIFTFTPDGRKNDKRSLLTLLVRILRLSLNESDSTVDLDASLAGVLREQIAKNRQDLIRVSGGATQYIGRFINLLYHGGGDARRYLDSLMGAEIKNSPRKVVSEVDDTEARTNAEKRLAAKRRQEALLAAHKKKNASLMQKMMLREGLTKTQMDAIDTTQNSEVRHYECPICGDTTANTLSHPVGSLVSIVNNYAVEHSLPADDRPVSLLELDAEAIKNNRCMPERNMMKHCDVAKRALLEQVTRPGMCF